ncbi:MAG: Asp-tRNA(Asn)/Glu-tRNA(Gln) amidotransferase subunit GatC [Planctomycetota bacterium]|nr:Asp-tRNA(Asn)/Glu-tRNA(Gln) amidotransferase subunit GatC [Planctomycetota bacterium]
MTIEENLIHHLSELARIRLSPEEESRYQKQLQSVIGYMEKLKTVDVEGIEPLAHVGEITGGMRPDQVSPSFSPEKALENAPSASENRFVVPKVVE